MDRIIHLDKKFLKKNTLRTKNVTVLAQNLKMRQLLALEPINSN